MISFVRKHPLGVGVGSAAVLAALAWLAFGFFGVHTLFLDDVVDEAGPVFDAAPVEAAPAATAAGTSPSTPAADAATDTVGDPTSPTVAPDTAPVTDPPTPVTTVPAAPAVVTEYRGTFESDAHPTSGRALVLGNGTDQRFLRLEDFATDNGPDLNVYLVDSSTGDVSDFIDLGDLSGNIGDQNYEIPAGVDLDRYDEVVIWCVRFGVGFGDARLVAA
jgi:Electron transfer DM13